jgi:hypothetical protein
MSSIRVGLLPGSLSREFIAVVEFIAARGPTEAPCPYSPPANPTLEVWTTSN